MRILIIDDEDRARKSIVDLLKLTGRASQLVGEANSVASGKTLIDKENPDLVLLDINLTDGTGFDLIKMFPEVNFKVIFITAYEEFAINAFEFSAIDYLLKPVDPLKFEEAISKASEVINRENIQMKLTALFNNMDHRNQDKKTLVLKTAESIFLVETKDVIRCKSDSGYTQFYLEDGKNILVSRNLIDYEEMLSGFGFYRIHQSHLINIKFIDHYNKADGGSVVMKDGSVLPVARRKKESFLRLLDFI